MKNRNFNLPGIPTPFLACKDEPPLGGRSFMSHPTGSFKDLDFKVAKPNKHSNDFTASYGIITSIL